MKRLLLLFLMMLICANFLFGQDIKKYDQYCARETNTVALKYADPYYPADFFEPGANKFKMEEYAKLHPPIPLKPNTGNAAYDNAKSEQDQAEWLQMNPYYPQFVPYHLYNRLLTPEDDVAFYEAAKAAWVKANPEKANEIENAAK